jgi:hypothetical protein
MWSSALKDPVYVASLALAFGHMGISAAESRTAPAALKPYGGTGGGHHIPAKAAFKGAKGFDANKVLAIPNEEMARLGINHGLVSGAQQKLYRALAASGEEISWGAMRCIEIQALIKGGASSKIAQATVDKAISALRNAGIEPTRIPWGGK